MKLPSDTEVKPVAIEADDNGDASATRFRQYRAPRQHGEVFVDPPFDSAGESLHRNRELAASYGDLIGELRKSARTTLVENAIDYTSVYRDVEWARQRKDAPITMAGHQPSLFHPGVWFKNFALSHLASRTGTLAINLVVDNDVAAGCAIRVPSIHPDDHRVGVVSVPYDLAGGGVPYEQTTIQDRDTFDQFADRVANEIRPIVPDPCIDRLWSHAKAAVRRCGVAGCALAQARHALEDEVGLQTLEVPLGVACRGAGFAEFALSILSELPRFHRCYNDSADLYRAAHGIRSSAHPVPNLAQQDDWFEAPLWVYGNDAPVRRPVWARMSNDELVISDRVSREIRVETRHPKLAAEQLAAAASPNFKLRPRALLTTMYGRLVLSDLFLHGIGGAKYDQLGDMIIRSFFGVTPPEIMVNSATVQLPGVTRQDDRASIDRLRRGIRDTRYQPERFADEVDLDDDLLQQKRELLSSIPPRHNRKTWHDRLDNVNRSLSRECREVRAVLNRKLAVRQREAASSAILASREHPFCLFPLDYLTETFGRHLT